MTKLFELRARGLYEERYWSLCRSFLDNKMGALGLYMVEQDLYDVPGVEDESAAKQRLQDLATELMAESNRIRNHQIIETSTLLSGHGRPGERFFP
jgi:hypothetical protein